jgi:hypothetical protein
MLLNGVTCHVLPQGVQQLTGASYPGMLDVNQDAPLVDIGAGNEASGTKDAVSHSSVSIRSSRPTGVGMGKPVFMDDETGKKGGSGRQRVSCFKQLYKLLCFSTIRTLVRHFTGLIK